MHLIFKGSLQGYWGYFFFFFKTTFKVGLATYMALLSEVHGSRIPRYIYFGLYINSCSFKIIFMVLVHSSETLFSQTAEHQNIFDIQVLHFSFSQLSLTTITLFFKVVRTLEYLLKPSNVLCLKLFWDY